MSTAAAWSAGQAFKKFGNAAAATTAVIAAVIKDPEFERLHPRGRDGRFITKGGYVKFLDIKTSMWRRARVDDFTDDGRVKVSWNGAEGKRVEEVMKKNWLYHADAPKATLNPAGWKKVGAQAGSNPGGFFEDKDDVKWYVKNPPSKLHAANENLMNRLYAKAGAPAPETAVSPDGKRFMTKIEDSVDWHSISGDRLELVKKIAAKNFVVDAWLANWDAPLNDNIRVTPDNVVLRVDAGGAGLFRARGDRRLLTSDVKELKSMRDSSLSGRSGGATLYEAVTENDEIDAVKRIAAITPDEIQSMVAEEGLPRDLAVGLIARRAWLANKYSVPLPENTPEGQAALKELADAKTAKEKAEAEEAVKALIKIAPETAVSLGPGAPVWVQKKTGVVVTPAGSKVPDLMIVSREVIDSSDGSKTYELETKDGKIKVLAKSDAFEVLRENSASENAQYSTGERPQIGDKVDQGKNGEGVVTELFPMYMRVAGADGKTRVSRINKSALIAKVGEHESSAAVLTAPGALAIGDLADMKNVQPMDVVYSLPHRANVAVVSYDDASQKAKVLLSSGSTATVPASKLYDKDSVNREAVDALPRKSPVARRRAATPKQLDVTTLPEKEIKPNRNVAVTIKPGDRILKVKKRSALKFFAIRTDGTIEYVGSNKTGTPREDERTSPSVILNELRNNDQIVDVTPAKYDQAAFEMGATDIKIAGTPKTINIKTLDYDLLREDVKAAGSAGFDMYTLRYAGAARAKYEKQVTFELTPQPADELLVFVDSGSPKMGIRIKDVGYTRETLSEFEEKHKDGDTSAYLPRVLLTRGGKHCDLGYGGENADDPTKWKPFNKDDYAKIKKMRDEYWSSYQSVPEPKDTLSDGTEIVYTKFKATNTAGVDAFKEEATALTVLNGKVADTDDRYWTSGIPGYDGKTPLISHFQKRATGWDKGNPAVKAASAPSAAGSTPTTYSVDVLESMPNGKVLTLVADTIGQLTKPITVTKNGTGSSDSTIWIRSDNNAGGSDSWVAKHDVIDPDPLSARKRTESELDALPVGARVRLPSAGGNRPDWNFEKTDKGWFHQEKARTETSKDLADVTPLEITQMPVQAGQPVVIEDFDKQDGYKALSHTLEVGRDQIRSGELDDRIHEIMSIKLETDNTNWRNNAVHKLPDGTQHGDPYMAQFAKDFDGDQQVLNLPGPAFNAIKQMTALPTLHRGVTQQDQRDAIKYGDHFNGTGAYGNGTYTAAAKTVTTSYGSNRVELTPKPGARGIQNDDMYFQQAEDMADAQLDRADILAAGTTLPNRQEIEQFDAYGKISEAEKNVRDQLERVFVSSNPSEDVKTFFSRAAVKAAVLYGSRFNDVDDIEIAFTSGTTRYYYGMSGVDTPVSLTIRNKKTKAALDFHFENPWSSQRTSYARAASGKMDKKKNFFVKTTLHSAEPGSDYVDKDRIAQQYDNGWWIDNFTNHLEATGIGSKVADNELEWQATVERMKKLDSRISFISDPGRWALSAGYDYFYIPGQEFYVFTHRAGFIVKK